MTYQALDQSTVINYLRGVDSLDGVLDRDADLRAREVGDGNLNLVFIVENADDPGQSVVLKQALPYLRVAGDSWPLTRERMRFETQALRKHNELAPGLVPTVYHADDVMSLVVMENLADLEVMRKPLVNRARFPHFTDHISTFMANTLFYTSDLYLTGVEKKELQARFINPHLCKIQEDFVFTNPFMESPENNWNPLLDDEVAAVRRNGPLKIAIAEMKAGYMTHGQALIHSDLHTGSIMANSATTKVIDPEFAFYGPLGFDAWKRGAGESSPQPSLPLRPHARPGRPRRARQDYLLRLVRDIWIGRRQVRRALTITTGVNWPATYWDYPGGDVDFALHAAASRTFCATWRLQRLQDAAAHDGHRQRLGYLQHRGSGPTPP
ncbi:MAG: S-methyl-5-thioribose kinase [Caldilineaceae bacterium]